MDYSSEPKKEEIGTGGKQVRFWENDIMGTGAIPMEDEMPRSLEFNQTAYDMDKKGWPDGLSRVVDSLPRAFSEKDLAEPAKFGIIEFEFSKNTPEEIPPIYVPKMHVDRERVVEGRLQALIDAGIYEEGTSTYASPWITIAKPNKPGEFRDCIDNRGINEFILTPNIPLTKAEDMISAMANMKKGFALDLTKAFFQVEIGPLTSKRCAVITPSRQALPKRLPMGAKPSSAYMEYLINKNIIFPLRLQFDSKGIAIGVFRDNIVGGAVDDEKFVELFRSLVDKLIEFNVKIGDAEIYKDRIKCLGFIIDLKGETSVEPLQKNLDKIKGFKTLGTIKDIRSLLGMTNFYRSFVPKYADLALPLEERLKEKPVPKNLEKDSQLQEDAEKLKSAVLKYSVLSAYDKDLPIEVYVDASGAAAGAVVVQRKSDGNCSIVRYWSKKFNDSQSKYNTTRREALSLVWAVKFPKMDLYIKGFIRGFAGENRAAVAFCIFS
jgi:hypothetical protein